jgi:hypothetical protein
MELPWKRESRMRQIKKKRCGLGYEVEGSDLMFSDLIRVVMSYLMI